MGNGDSAAPGNVPDDEQLLERQEETALTLRRIFHVLLGTLLFCAVTAATAPDAHLVQADVRVEMPIIGYAVPFDAFLVIGPFVIVALFIYMQIFYGEYLRCLAAHPDAKGKTPTLFNIDSAFSRLVTYLFFYWLPIVVLAFFAWKAAPRPYIGPALTGLTVALIVCLFFVQIIRFSGRMRRLAIWPLAAASIVSIAALIAVTGEFRRFDLFEADLSNKDLRDVTIAFANLRSANFRSADLRRAKLQSIDAEGADFSESNLHGADLTGARLAGVKFGNTDLSDATLAGANLQHADFREPKREPTAENAAGENAAGGSAPAPTSADTGQTESGPSSLRQVASGASAATISTAGRAPPSFPVNQIKQANSWILAHYSWPQLQWLGIEPPPAGVQSDPSIERSRQLNERNLVGWSSLAKQNLIDADLTGYRLNGADLNSADLTGAVLAGTNLQDAVLTEAKVTLAQVETARNWIFARYDDDDITSELQRRRISANSLDGADLTSLDLRDAVLAGYSARGAVFSDTNLIGAVFRADSLNSTDVQYADFRDARISRRELFQALNWQLAYFSPDMLVEFRLPHDHNEKLEKRDFSSTRFDEPLNVFAADLDDYRFDNATLTNAFFGRARLQSASFSKANLRRATFDEADLTGTDLSAADISDARFDNSILRNASLRQARSIGAQFSGADMKDADVAEARLVAANFNGARLTAANLKGANLLLAEIECDTLLQARNWKSARLNGARILVSTDRNNDCPESLQDLRVGGIATSRRLSPIYGQIRTVVADILGTTEDRVTDSADWIELGADDLDHVEIVIALEDGFGCTIPDDVAALIVDADTATRVVADCSEPAGGIEAVSGSTRPGPKRQVSVATIGDSNRDRRLVVSAITKVLSESAPDRAEFLSADSLDGMFRERIDRGIAIRTADVGFETEVQTYLLSEPLDEPGLAKGILSGALSLDAAILVVDGEGRPTISIGRQLRLVSSANVELVAVFINFDEPVDEKRAASSVANVRALLAPYDNELDPDIIVGSARTTLDGGGSKPIEDLIAAMDRHIAPPLPPRDGSFLMPVEDVFSISGRGTVVSGRVERGVLEVDDDVEIVGIHPTKEARVVGVEMFRKLLDQGQAGDNIGVVLRGVGRDEVERGQVLSKPGAVTPHAVFKAEVYMLTAEEGGRQTPIYSNYRPQFYFRTTDVTGVVQLLEGRETVAPGDQVTMRVELIVAVAMEETLRFVIREGGRTVGFGMVSEMVD